MITLSLDDYCQCGCTRFEPTGIRGLYADDPNTYVFCEHASECRQMIAYLKEHASQPEK